MAAGGCSAHAPLDDGGAFKEEAGSSFQQAPLEKGAGYSGETRRGDASPGPWCSIMANLNRLLSKVGKVRARIEAVEEKSREYERRLRHLAADRHNLQGLLSSLLEQIEKTSSGL